MVPSRHCHRKLYLYVSGTFVPEFSFEESLIAILLYKTALLLLAVENVYVDRTFVRGISEIRNRFHDSSI